ncbi:hypothetical protein BD410DRAFT_797327 [Rickenella mellea]|uniref:Uncharacterized protein n=1 Tax=Rickenella mellea TaxID=50990 RepID=A0A4Y7PFD8_9AGAM|nr:hypothetical protein BD410DRAFT_797327 [Rickenella mellea]
MNTSNLMISSRLADSAWRGERYGNAIARQQRISELKIKSQPSTLMDGFFFLGLDDDGHEMQPQGFLTSLALEF